MRMFFFYINLCILCFEHIFRRADIDTILVSISLKGIFKVFFKCDEIVSHISGPRYLRLSKPWFTVFTFEIKSCDLFLKFYWSTWHNRKRSFKISGEIPRCTLYISIVRPLRLLWFIETYLP